jgi:formiminotetrahydrofolate cyclodeaminase
MKTKYADGKIKNYLKDLAAKQSAPGGGSAAALAIAAYAVGKKGLEAFAPSARAIGKKAVLWQARSLRLLDADVAAYRAKDAVNAVRVPVEVCRIARDEARAAHTLMTRGNRFLATDAALAVYLAAGAYIAALGYIHVNLKYFKEKVRRFKSVARTLEGRRLEMKRLRSQAEVYLG